MQWTKSGRPARWRRFNGSAARLALLQFIQVECSILEPEFESLEVEDGGVPNQKNR